MICPHCSSKTEVLETAQRGVITRRRRRCLESGCGKRFSTIESLIGHEKPNVAVAEIAQAVARKTRRIEPEVLKAMLATDRRKARIARAQRESFERYDEHAAPRRLTREQMKRELGEF
jgi:transcriptional regulator NrdR family protein